MASGEGGTPATGRGRRKAGEALSQESPPEPDESGDDEHAGLVATVQGGDLRASLAAIRDDLARSIQRLPLCKRCGSSEVSLAKGPLVRQLRDVLQQLEDLGPPEGQKEETALERIRSSRDRRKDADPPRTPPGRGDQRSGRGGDRPRGKRGTAPGPVAAGRPARRPRGAS